MWIIWIYLAHKFKQVLHVQHNMCDIFRCILSRVLVPVVCPRPVAAVAAAEVPGDVKARWAALVLGQAAEAPFWEMLPTDVISKSFKGTNISLRLK